MKLDYSIKLIPGVGPKIAEKMEKLGIRTIRDLIFYFPRAWQDFGDSRKIAGLRIGEEAIVRAKIIAIDEKRTRNKYISIIEAKLEDSQGSQMLAVWFNQSFLKNSLKIGDEWLILGKIGWDFKGKIKTITPIQMENPAQIGPMIFPVYPETAGLNLSLIHI